jgi:hypothetical protein
VPGAPFSSFQGEVHRRGLRYFFFLAAFLAGFLATFFFAAFFLATALPPKKHDLE